MRTLNREFVEPLNRGIVESDRFNAFNVFNDLASGGIKITIMSKIKIWERDVESLKRETVESGRFNAFNALTWLNTGFFLDVRGY
jgi:hypothetical protein